MYVSKYDTVMVHPKYKSRIPTATVEGFSSSPQGAQAVRPRTLLMSILTKIKIITEGVKP